MYNTQHNCIYNSDNIFLDTDTVNDSEKACIRDILYRQDILTIFDIDDFEDKKINASIFELYEKVKKYHPLQQVIIELAGNIMTSEKELGFIIMYSFDYLYITHVCVSELLEKGCISSANLDKLKKITHIKV